MASSQLSSPTRALIEPRRLSLRGLEERAKAAMPVLLERGRHRLGALDASLRALNPSAVLDRGYAVIRQEARIVPRMVGVDKSVPVRICFSDGELTADITATARRDDTI